jgi:hypothetical protein
LDTFKTGRLPVRLKVAGIFAGTKHSSVRTNTAGWQTVGLPAHYLNVYLRVLVQPSVRVAVLAAK